MILDARHRDTERVFEKGASRRDSSNQVPNVERILASLDESEVPGDMDLLGFRLHPLKDDLGASGSPGVRQPASRHSFLSRGCRLEQRSPRA